MTPRIILLIAAAVTLTSCSSKELSREKAFSMVEKKYPQTEHTYLYCGDPSYIGKVEKTTLVQDGFLELNKNRKDISEPFIIFKEKSKPYLLPTEKEDIESKVQKVKLYEIVLDEVTGIKMLSDNKKAIVTYTVKYKDVSPFIAMTKIDVNKPATKTAYFSLYDDGWRLEDKPGIDFLVN